MEEKVSIQVTNLVKTYKLGLFNYKSFIEEVKILFNKKKITELKSSSKYINALNNISFTVLKGDRIALIGKNGSGKSTFLKILSRVTLPSEGEIKYRGKISSILEQGIGFHPEMTARDNIYLNASILGESKKNIRNIFDEIVDFAGIKNFVNTPTKRFSSGMITRLGFAINAHIYSDILLIDEVLAVGDAEFRMKCFNKINEISKNNNSQTLIFVSHETELLKKICNRGIVLNKGQICFDGQLNAAIDFYEKNIA